MATVEVNENLTEIDGRVRIESGPILKTAVATVQTLGDDVTAGHYTEGKRDARGKVIVLGEEFAYLDYRAAHGFYVYELVEAEGETSTWVERGCYEDRGEAVAAAENLLS